MSLVIGKHTSYTSIQVIHPGSYVNKDSDPDHPLSPAFWKDRAPFSGSLPTENVCSWQPGPSPQLCFLWLKWSPVVLRPLGFYLSSSCDRYQEDELSSSEKKKKPQLNILIKARWFSCLLLIHNQYESLSADLKPGQGVFGPSLGWPPERYGMY